MLKPSYSGILPVARGAGITLFCRKVSKTRHDPDATIEIRTFGVTFGHGQTAPPRSLVPPANAVWDQLVYATRGVMTVRAERAAWLVPPHRAVWIRAGVPFQVEMAGTVALRMLYVRPTRRRAAGEACRVVNVSPLLRELIVRAVHLGALDAARPAQKRLIGVIRDELAALTAVPLQLPLPQDARAARLAELVREGGAAQPLARLLRQAGASRRTMERLFRAETAMSLGQWLRRARLLEGLRRMAAGGGVAEVALELGYSGASAFIAMFRRELGQTPHRYL
jgi:AraC-like DNA-binding protein